MTELDVEGATGTASESRLASASIYCERCGTETPHRVFRLRPVGRGPTRGVEGVARCRTCRWTHPFEQRPEPRVEVAAIVSRRSNSTRHRVFVPPDAVIELGGNLEVGRESLIVRRIERRDGHTVGRGRAETVATVWGTLASDRAVPVSLVEGARTVPAEVELEPNRGLSVGDRLRVAGLSVEVVALRARGHTWRRSGDRFAATEIERVYARRTEIPPAGRSDWRSGRGTPRSRTSVSSVRPRSRSSPGVSKTRTSPRARTAGGGAAVHRSRPS